MNVRAVLAILAVAASAAGPQAVRAQAGPSPQAAPAAAEASPRAPARAASAPRTLVEIVESAESREPAVRHVVIEDGGSKVDELNVRGEVQHVVVTPKVGTTRSYEIIVPRGGRTPPDSTGGAQSAVGKRVWSVLAF